MLLLSASVGPALNGGQMVLDAGRVVECGAPAALLRVPGGLLRALVDESAEREELYALALRGARV